ncbi:MAG: RES family NAD+ phosphorylase [Gammaproteobacteria bacterium]|nr:RES family NAD+ phosphorylase [Gammaproteobacteria bacterium]
MALPIWIQSALRCEQKLVDATFWRCVEAQHVVSTLQLVDALDEQHLLEYILEEAKPPIPPECEGLHYLYMTPFRYGPYPSGSRFRKAGTTPGVYYASQEPSTAIIETAFHLLLFYADSPGTPFPSHPSEHTAFDVPAKTTRAIDLMAEPFNDASDLWMHPDDYKPCQQLEELARAESIQLIRYASVRDPCHKPNAAILACEAFSATAPSQNQTWRLWFNEKGIHAVCEFKGQRFSVSPEVWQTDPKLKAFDWRAR